jgi:hypothetical protein
MGYYEDCYVGLFARMPAVGCHVGHVSDLLVLVYYGIGHVSSAIR